MELLMIAALTGIAYWAYKTGKQTGSRGGFYAGWQRGHRSATKKQAPLK